jgi:hypothetical protein
MKGLNISSRSNDRGVCTYILEKLGHERHSHSSQFSVRRESLGGNFRDAVLLQPPADNQGKNKLYRNKLTNSRIHSGSRY